jgi:GxxExxY protein
MSNPLLHSELTEQVIGAAYEVYNELGFGFLETVYEKSLVIALRDRGIVLLLKSRLMFGLEERSLGTMLLTWSWAILYLSNSNRYAL